MMNKNKVSFLRLNLQHFFRTYKFFRNYFAQNVYSAYLQIIKPLCKYRPRMVK